MAKDKSIMVTHRTHEILRREVISTNAENLGAGKEGETNLKAYLADFAEKIQENRDFADLPEKDGN